MSFGAYAPRGPLAQAFALLEGCSQGKSLENERGPAIYLFQARLHQGETRPMREARFDYR